MTTTQTTDDAAAAAAASDEHVRRLQSQLQSTAEQVVGASGSQAVEPGQPAATSATTAQPGVPRYVVPPATSDLAYGRSHWDGKPAEIHAMILKLAGPLTRFLCGLLGDKATLDEATKLELWIEAFKMDWQGDLALLPDANLTAGNGLLLAHSRSMYDRLCKRFPQYTERYYEREDDYSNNYDLSFDVTLFDSHRLLLIPMWHGWLDLLDFLYPITLARMAIRFGCLDLLKHLDDKYSTLKDWMAKQDVTSDYWHDAVDDAASNGHLDVMQYLFAAGVTGCTTEAMDIAAYGGHLHVVKWLHTNRTEGCTAYAMNYAAEDGHLHVVKWLHANRTEGCTTAAMDKAAGNGHLHVLQWLHANRAEGCTAKAMDKAAANGHLHVIKWLHETRGEGFPPWALGAAISRGHVDVVKYMHSTGGRASSGAVRSAASTGNAEMLRYLMECGYAVKLEALNHAKTADIADILLGSLTLDQAQALLAEARQVDDADQTTIERLESAIKKLLKPGM